MAQAAPAATPHRFYAHARDEGRARAHLIPGAKTLQDAALRFVEHWGGPAEAGEVRVIAFDGETGEERCFCVDLGQGEAEACG
jgi:hypothetical protein